MKVYSRSIKITLKFIWHPLIIVLVAHCLFSCSLHESECVKLKPIKTVRALSDTIYLSSQVSNLACSDDRYFLSDYYHGIVSFDQNFGSVEKEVVNSLLPTKPQCYMFSVGGTDDICVYNPAEKMFVCKIRSTKWDNVKTENYQLSFPSRFALCGDSIVCSIIKNKMTTAIFHEGLVIKTCCPTIDGFDDIRKPYHSERMTIYDGMYYFVIGKGLPLVQLYTSDFKMVSSFNLMEIEEIKTTVVQQKTDKPNSYFVVVQDVYAAGGKIFLLIATKPEGRFRSNKILVLKITNNILELENFYELDDKIYSTFCVNKKGQIVIVNSKSSAIEIYEI